MRKFDFSLLIKSNMYTNINQRLIFILSVFSLAKAWYSCPFNDGSFNRTIFDDVVIQAECTFLTSPLEWNQFDPNTFDGIYYNQTKKIPLTDLHLKRLFFSQLQPEKNVSIEHTIHYWLVNGGGGSQYGMESFGISMLNEIVRNRYHVLYPQTRPIMYLFQYRGAGMSRPSIHCHTARSWTGCAEELIRTTVPSSRDESLKIIHAISNANIAQDLQYQIQYAINESILISPTSTYIYGLSQGNKLHFDDDDVFFR